MSYLIDDEYEDNTKDVVNSSTKQQSDQLKAAIKLYVREKGGKVLTSEVLIKVVEKQFTGVFTTAELENILKDVENEWNTNRSVKSMSFVVEKVDK